MLEKTSADEVGYNIVYRAVGLIPRSQIPLENSLRAAIQQMKNSIISNEGTQVAIYFIGSVRINWIALGAVRDFHAYRSTKSLRTA